MQTVKTLIQELKKFPLDARCHAFESSVPGPMIVISEPEIVTFPNGGKGRPGIGYVTCTERDELDGPAVFFEATMSMTVSHMRDLVRGFLGRSVSRGLSDNRIDKELRASARRYAFIGSLSSLTQRQQEAVVNDVVSILFPPVAGGI